MSAHDVLAELYAQVDEFGFPAGLKGRIKEMLAEAYGSGYDQASIDSCGCLPYHVFE